MYVLISLGTNAAYFYSLFSIIYARVRTQSGPLLGRCRGHSLSLLVCYPMLFNSVSPFFFYLRFI